MNYRHLVAAIVLLVSTAAHAHDMSGIHAFFNDDRNQFVDFWLNTGGAVTMKVSNGRPWRPMRVVVHAIFKAGDSVLSSKDYHVFCEAPAGGGGGAERWFTFASPATGATSVSITTSKE